MKYYGPSRRSEPQRIGYAGSLTQPGVAVSNVPCGRGMRRFPSQGEQKGKPVRGNGDPTNTDGRVIETSGK